MIISENQIWQLMNAARYILFHLGSNQSIREKIKLLLDEIEKQQSEKLFEVKDE